MQTDTPNERSPNSESERAAETADLVTGQPSHVLFTNVTCPCDKSSDAPCNVCDGGLAICSVCGKAESELDERCDPAPPKLINVPERIWLQVGWALAPDTAPDYEVDGEIDFQRIVNEDTTWCQDAIEQGDVEYVRTDSYAVLVAAAKAALEYVDNLNEDTPVDPNCKECVGRVFFTKGTPEPPLCWIHQLEKAVATHSVEGEQEDQNDQG